MSACSSRILILAHHKCATRFLRLYLEEFCTRNNRTLFRSHLGTARSSSEHHISLLTNAEYAAVLETDAEAVVHIIRNPLSIVASAYYSHLISHDLSGWPELAKQRLILKGCTRDRGLAKTLEFLEGSSFFSETMGPLQALRRWNYASPNQITLKMEDVVLDANATLGQQLVEVFGHHSLLPQAEAFRFASLAAGRHPGQQDNESHFRSGDPENWRHELPNDFVRSMIPRYKCLLERFYPDVAELMSHQH